MTILATIVGGILSIIGGWFAARYQIKKLHQQEIENRKWEEKEKKTAALNAFYVETKENIESINRWKVKHGYFRFGIDAWDLFKPSVKNIDSQISQKLIKAYSEMRRHNTAVDYHIQLLSSGRDVSFQTNMKEMSINEGITEIEGTLSSLNQELVNKLDVIPPIQPKKKAS